MLQTLKQSLPDLLQPYRSKTRWLIYLTLGLITTIITSWTCAYFVDVTSSEPVAYLGQSRPQAPYCEIYLMNDFGSQACLSVDVLNEADSYTDLMGFDSPENQELPHWSRASTLAPTTTAGLEKMYLDLDQGWPCLSLSSALDIPMISKGAANYPIDIKYGIDLGPFPLPPGTPNTRRILPLKPIIPGLIINTLFYTLTLFAIPTFIFTTIRHHHRLAKSHCPTCNYDLRKNPATRCPECGWNRPTNPVPQRIKKV